MLLTMETKGQTINIMRAGVFTQKKSVATPKSLSWHWLFFGSCFLLFVFTVISKLALILVRMGGGGGGCNPKKTERYPKSQIWDWFFSFFFFGFFRFFFGFSILANFDWFNRFLLSGSCWL